MDNKCAFILGATTMLCIHLGIEAMMPIVCSKVIVVGVKEIENDKKDEKEGS